MTGISVALSQFIPMIVGRMGDGDEGQVVEEIVAEVLDDNNWSNLILDEPLHEEEEERIFDALVSSNKILSVLIVPTYVLEVRSMEPMLRKAVTALPNLTTINMGLALTESEAERILSILRMSPSLNRIILCLRECTDGITKPLAKYLQESVTLSALLLNWAPPLEETDSSTISQDGFASICEGIGECTSLKLLLFLGEPPADEEDSNMAARSVALAMANSKSLDLVGVDSRYREFRDKVRDSLALAPVMQNFNLFIRESESERSTFFWLNRAVPWRPLLSKNIPLALWPRILAKANAWNRHSKHYVSHGPLDALFFLMREKNDVLLQNVRRRKIRKRKRGQFYF
jgi:hypothetical protein